MRRNKKDLLEFYSLELQYLSRLALYKLYGQRGRYFKYSIKLYLLRKEFDKR